MLQKIMVFGMLVLFGVCSIVSQAASNKIALTSNGQPVATIITAETPTLPAAFAVKELNEHIKLITGTTLPVVKDDTNVTGPKLYVGDSPGARKLGVSSDGFKDQEYAVKFLPLAVVFVGKDENVPAPADGGPQMPDFFHNKGTLTAVYDFLYYSCGVRWYIPNELGTCYDKRASLTVSGRSVRRVPNMRYMWMYNVELWMPTGEDNVPRPEANLWKLRVGQGGQQFTVNHSFYGYYDRFLKDHPDWFAQGYENTGVVPPQLCYTNPEVIAQVVQDARDYFDGKGIQKGAQAMGDYFGLVPMDNGDFCKCARCQAEYGNMDKNDTNFSTGAASNYVWGFINKVAKEVKKTHPTKYIAALSYWAYSKYPTNVKLESNIAVMLCMDTREWYMPQTRDNGMAIYNSWVTKEKDRQMYLWLYFCFPALTGMGSKFPVFPGYYASTAVKHSTMFNKNNIQGIFMEHSSEAHLSHLLDLPEVYLTVVMGRDSRINGKKALNEFFKRFYGNAAKPMQDLYKGIEDTYYNPKNYPTNNVWFGGQTEEIAWGYLGTPERMAKFGLLMEQAKLAAKTDLEKKRVTYFEKGVWNYMKEGVELHKGLVIMRSQDPPKVSIPKQAAVISDGDSSKVDWSKAVSLTGWRIVSGKESKRQIEAKLTHDSKYLYVQLEEMLDPKTLKAAGEIWFDDDFEVFIAPKRSKPYRQLAMNPNNVHVEYEWDATSSKWDSGAIFTSNTSLPDRWQVRIALPLDKLVPGGAKVGTPFYANFYRTIANQSEFLAWSPNFAGNFQEMSRLGEMNLE